MTGCKTDEAREFYLRLCIANRYTKRELDRQIGSMLYERTMISHEKHKDLLAGNGGLAALRDSYVFEFLDLEEPYKEKDLRHQIVSHLKDFILEFGHDFTFVGEEYRVQVGNTDFFIDLLFYNRALSCLVAIELKIDTFRPEHLGQLNFYLEALDRDVKKPNGVKSLTSVPSRSRCVNCSNLPSSAVSEKKQYSTVSSFIDLSDRSDRSAEKFFVFVQPESTNLSSCFSSRTLARLCRFGQS